MLHPVSLASSLGPVGQVGTHVNPVLQDPSRVNHRFANHNLLLVAICDTFCPSYPFRSVPADQQTRRLKTGEIIDYQNH